MAGIFSDKALGSQFGDRVVWFVISSVDYIGQIISGKSVLGTSLRKRADQKSNIVAREKVKIITIVSKESLYEACIVMLNNRVGRTSHQTPFANSLECNQKIFEVRSLQDYKIGVIKTLS